MDGKFFEQLVAELIAAQGQALGMVVAAMARQVDPARLMIDLRAQIAAAGQMQSISPIAVRIATEALAAAEAEKMLRATPASAGRRPT